MRNFIILGATLALVAGAGSWYFAAGRPPAPGPATSAVSDGLNISPIPEKVAAQLPKGVSVNPAIMQVRQAQGVWRSQVGVLPAQPTMWVELSIAGDRTFVASLRTGTLKKVGIMGEATGVVRFDRSSISGTATKIMGVKAKALARWSTPAPQAGRLSVAFGDGKPIQLTYVGV